MNKIHLNKESDACLEAILAVCSDEFDVSLEEVRSPSRMQELVYCRKAFCIVIKESLDLKLEVIGCKINRSIASVSTLITQQPADKYYSTCLTRIREKTRRLGLTSAGS